MGTQLVLSFAKRYFFNLSNALNSKHNSQTIRTLSPYRNISLFSLVFILKQMTNVMILSIGTAICEDDVPALQNAIHCCQYVYISQS